MIEKDTESTTQFTSSPVAVDNRLTVPIKTGPGKSLQDFLNNLKLNPSHSFEEQLKSIDDQIRVFNGDTQVTEKKQRSTKRYFSKKYKLQILDDIDACKTADDRASLLRREGLYAARVSEWKAQRQNGLLISNKTPKSVLVNQQLTREVASLKKKLFQAEAIIDLQKKVSALLSINTLDQELREMRF